MRILYGVVGEGMGHATRSSVILRHLAPRHAVEVVVSGRAHGYLRRSFPDLKIHEIAGMNISYTDNRVHRKRTFWENIKKLPAFAQNFETFVRLGEAFRPELVISDFESFAYYYAKQHDLPVISIDNMQIINRCDHSELKIPKGERNGFRISRTIVKAKLPGCDHYLITTFFFPPVRRKRTTLYPPILRAAILEAQPSPGEHVLVYQTSDSSRELIPTLERIGCPFVVYGMNKEPGAADVRQGNVTLKAFSEDGFVRDLASARAVLAGGGFSLMGEAVQLGKPLLSVPVEKQFEQTLNALYLEKLGYGEYHEKLKRRAIEGFLERTPEYSANLRRYPHRADHNRSILTALDDLVDRIAYSGRLV